MSQEVIHYMLATRYAKGARGPLSFDCWGLIMDVCRRMAWPVPRDPLAFATSPHEAMMLFRQEMREHEWRRCGPTDGAVAFWGRMDRAVHAGIVIEGGILHTQAPVEGMTAGGPSWKPVADFNLQKMEFASWARSSSHTA